MGRLAQKSCAGLCILDIFAFEVSPENSTLAKVYNFKSEMGPSSNSYPKNRKRALELNTEIGKKCSHGQFEFDWIEHAHCAQWKCEKWNQMKLDWRLVMEQPIWFTTPFKRHLHLMSILSGFWFPIRRNAIKFMSINIRFIRFYD